ncbi:MAG: efflux RND transporter periplasmic adaptor subunit [Paracoccaceae bacterium]|nr:efflux RND transporter periplasmic adaptor subunit [Paracoccaceae bacterium]
MSDATKPSLLKRGARAVFTSAVTLSVVAGAGGAVYLGADTLTARAAATPPPETAALTQVAVERLTFETGYSVPRRFVGQVESRAQVPLSFELGGRLTMLSVEEGATVTEGQEIARLDTALLKAEQTRLEASRNATAAQLDLAETRLARATSLRAEGHASQETLDQVTAIFNELTGRIAEIDAALNSIDINLKKSVLHAPFAGQVGARAVDGGETLAAGAPVLTLIDTARPEIRVGLPLNLDADDLTSAQMDIGGALYAANLVNIRPDIDPVTRTRTAVFALDADAALTFGQTAALVLETQVDAKGTWVPIDALQEGAGDVWTVLTVADGTVRNASVELLHTEATRAYVRGTFENGANLIRSGAHRVVPGQSVTIINAEG